MAKLEAGSTMHWDEPIMNAQELALWKAKEHEILRISCKEVLDWQKTGLLVDGEVRRLAASLTDIPETHRLSVAEKKVADAAMRFVINSE